MPACRNIQNWKFCLQIVNTIAKILFIKIAWYRTNICICRSHIDLNLICYDIFITVISLRIKLFSHLFICSNTVHL